MGEKTGILLRRIRLYVQIVLRIDSSGERMDPRTAWAVAKLIWR